MGGLVVLAVAGGACGGGGGDDDGSSSASAPVAITCPDESATVATVPASALPDGIPLPAGAVVLSDRSDGPSDRLVTGTVPVGVDQVSAAYVLALAGRPAVKTRVPSTGRTVDGATIVRVPLEGSSSKGELDVRDCGGSSAFLLRLSARGRT